MATIAELTGSALAEHWPEAASEPHPLPENTTPHIYWGDPPDLATCDSWMRQLLAFYDDVQRELAFARTGGRILDTNGVPLSHEAFSAWRTDKVRRGHKAMRRYRWLKSWRTDNNHRLSEEREAARPADQVAIAQANGGALKRAVKRYGKLESLFCAAAAYVEEDSDEAWERFLAALDDVAAADNPATEGGA